ncbi:MAG TPA: hypothetical protein VJR04_06205 [Terriglobales bacterium]|nr:hypothetical protein [Terriglobales bacterium]
MSKLARQDAYTFGDVDIGGVVKTSIFTGPDHQNVCTCGSVVTAAVQTIRNFCVNDIDV